MSNVTRTTTMTSTAGTARDAEHYAEAWEQHLRSLATLALQADAPGAEYTEVMVILRRWIADGKAFVKFNDSEVTS
jgi:hypothetical protein